MKAEDYLRYLRKKLLMIQRVMANTRVQGIKESWFADQIVVKEEAEKKRMS